jgi:chemotaxis protein CheD
MEQQNKPPFVDVNLAPGEFHFSGGYTRIHTLLGSCVAITMWHPAKHIGGMCHYLLPSRGANQRLSQGHYADGAVQLFLCEIKKTHTRPSEYEVKLFGGSNMFEALGHKGTAVNVSKSNIDTGVSLLLKHGFTINAKDVGGARYRRIYLELWSGDVWVQQGKNPAAEQNRHG